MNFLITGGSGYLGQYLQRELVRHKHAFVAIDNGPRILYSSRKDQVWAPVDIRHIHALTAVLRRRGPFDCIIHLAAISSVPACEADPETCHAVNVQGTQNVITAARRTRTPRILFASSSAVYGDSGTNPVPEDWPTLPASHYGRSKLRSEVDLLASGLDVCILRLANVVGGKGEPVGRLIPSLLTCLKRNEDFPVCGNSYPTPDGTAVRDYICVEETASLIRQVAETPTISGVYNVGSGIGHSVTEVVHTALEVSGIRVGGAREVERRAGDVGACVLDRRKITGATGWWPVRSLADVIRAAWEEMQ